MAEQADEPALKDWVTFPVGEHVLWLYSKPTPIRGNSWTSEETCVCMLGNRYLE